MPNNLNSTANSITGNAVNDEITKENKLTISSIDESEIIKEIGQKTNLDKDKIKRAINFKRKEPVKEAGKDEEFGFAPLQPLTRIKEINGSVIVTLG